MDTQPVVIDNGTEFTKMEYEGNLDPDFLIPTTIFGEVDFRNGCVFQGLPVSENRRDKLSFNTVYLFMEKILSIIKFFIQIEKIFKLIFFILLILIIYI